MLTQQRHEIILELLREKGSITVTEVKDLLDTSESTVRRDITALDKEGKLELLWDLPHFCFFPFWQLLHLEMQICH